MTPREQEGFIESLEHPERHEPRLLPRNLAARLGIARRRCRLMSGMGDRYDVAKRNLRRVLVEVAKFRELTEDERWYFESPDDLCSLEVLFNGKRETILEISRRNIPVIEADKRYVIIGKPVKLGYGAAKDSFCEKFGTEEAPRFRKGPR